MAMIKTKKIGVYYNVLDDKDKVFYFTYKDINDNNKKKWVKVGKYSDGIREINAFNLRSEQISKMKHGQDITAISTKKKKTITTFNDLARKYFQDKKSSNERINKYNNHIKPLFGNKKIEMIDKNDVRKLVNSVLDLGRSNGTANSVRELFSTIINHNIKEYDLIYVNPCIGIPKLKADNKREKFLSVSEINLLKDEIKDNFLLTLFVELALQTGGRLETILHIQKKDIDLINKTVSLNNLKTKNKYTGFLQNELIETLKIYLPKLKINDYVINHNNICHKKLDHKKIHRRLKPILDKLFNIGLDPEDRENRTVIHTFRHTFASHLAINGTPIFTIQKLMDHKDIKQTLRYAKLSPESGKNDVQGLYR